MGSASLFHHSCVHITTDFALSPNSLLIFMSRATCSLHCQKPFPLTIIVHGPLIVFLIKDTMGLHAEWLGCTVVEDYLDGITYFSPYHWSWKNKKIEAMRIKTKMKGGNTKVGREIVMKYTQDRECFPLK